MKPRDLICVRSARLGLKSDKEMKAGQSMTMQDSLPSEPGDSTFNRLIFACSLDVASPDVLAHSFRSRGEVWNLRPTPARSPTKLSKVAWRLARMCVGPAGAAQESERKGEGERPFSSHSPACG